MFALSLTGIVIRVIVARQSLFGDELSTYWIVVGHNLHQVLSLLYGSATIHHEHIRHAEITPPLYFLAAWLTTRFGHSPELLRLPSLIAGALTIPLVYRLGLRTVGRAAALVGCALTALSPFMIYYSTEGRAYALMMLLVVASTLGLLVAVERRQARWWVLYGLSSCLAVYSHYTCVFVLGVQVLWVLWAHPEARRPVILANLGAAAGLLPWLPGLIQDFTSPTLTILSALSPFTLHDIPRILGHWAIGYPYATDTARLTDLPGLVALVLLGVATLVGLLGARSWRRPDRRLLLVVGLALATPVGEALVSLFGTHIFGVRNLAASWPTLALAFAALLCAAPSWGRIAAATLAIVGFGIGAALMLSAAYSRPNYAAAARFVERHVGAHGVVIDETGEVSPGPVTSLDTALTAPVPVFRAGSPDERTHPFGFSDPIVPLAGAVRSAAAAARGGPIVLVRNVIPPGAQFTQRREPANPVLPAPYHLVSRHVYPGVVATEVRLYSRS